MRVKIVKSDPPNGNIPNGWKGFSDILQFIGQDFEVIKEYDTGEVTVILEGHEMVIFPSEYEEIK